ncbi:MAG: hypothetical protein Q9180_006569 [Flavoplaca navasiana]
MPEPDPYRLRAIVEQYHYETVRKIFALPPELSLPMQSSSSKEEEQLSRVLSFRGYHSNQSTGRHLSMLKPDDAKIFCWKDCAVYGIHTDSAGQVGSIDTYGLLERGYRTWFPRRSMDRDVDDGNFWGIPVWLQLYDNKFQKNIGRSEERRNSEPQAEELGDLAQVWSFHEMFCEQLQGLAANIDQSKAGKWELRQSSTEVVMIVDVRWEEKGVRLTWKANPVEHYAGFATHELAMVEQNAQGGFWELHCSLERAIRIVASRDPERRGGRWEAWNHQFEETLVDEDDDEGIGT